MSPHLRFALVAACSWLCVSSAAQPHQAQKVNTSTTAATTTTGKQVVVTNPAESPQPAALATKRYGSVNGDFSTFLDERGTGLAVKVSVLNQDLQLIGEASSNSFTKDKMEIFYTQTDPKAVPAFVLVGTQSPGDHLYPFTASTPRRSWVGPPRTLCLDSRIG